MRIFALMLLSLASPLNKNHIAIQPLEPALVPYSAGQPANILFQSSDGGKTWQDLSKGLPERLQVTNIFAQNGEVFLGSQGGRLYHSSNPATGIWDREDLGVTFPNFCELSMSENVTGIFPGHSGPYACIYEGGFLRRVPGTNRWQHMDGALEEKTIFAVLEDKDGTIFLGSPSGIYKSKDDGETWKHIYTKSSVTSLVAAGGVLVGSTRGGLLRSTDGGESWDYVLTDEGAIYHTSTIDGGFAAIRLAAPFRNTVRPVPLRTSVDGKTWQGLQEALSPIQRINDLVQAGKYLFCSHKGGISRSVDGGKTWELMRPAKGTGDAIRLNLAASGKIVFAVMVPGGC